MGLARTVAKGNGAGAGVRTEIAIGPTVVRFPATSVSTASTSCEPIDNWSVSSCRPTRPEVGHGVCTVGAEQL